MARFVLATTDFDRQAEPRSQLPLFQQTIDDPATPDVRPWPSQMGEDGGVGATGVFKGIGQDGETVEIESATRKDASLIGRSCQGDNG